MAPDSILATTDCEVPIRAATLSCSAGSECDSVGMSETLWPPGAGSAGMKLAEQTAAKLELAIVEQGWPQGRVLGSEAELLAEYRVSRAVLREAVRLLEHDSVAYMRRGPGGGLVVAEPDAAAVTRAATRYLRHRAARPDQLFAARIAIEVAAAKSAAEHLDERGVEVLREVLVREAAAGEEIDVTGHDFHLAVARLSGNPAVELCADVLVALSAGALTGGAGQDVHSAHEAIAEAIIGGDLGLAQHRTTRHLQAVAALAGRNPATAAPATARPARRRRR